jgi:hypothetical protein
LRGFCCQALIAKLLLPSSYCLSLDLSKLMNAVPESPLTPKTTATGKDAAPLRPKPPVAPAAKPATPDAQEPALKAAPKPGAGSGTSVVEESDLSISRLQPISPPSERLQYRAIGLIRGQYRPSDKGFNRGLLVTQDGTELDAVLLGQVMSLVKKHLDLEQEHLWVVYPRTREKQKSLHVQIVGVWEPEQLQPGLSASNAHHDGYFSVRGELLFQNEEKKYVVIKIQQSARKGTDKGKAFKLRLEGDVETRSPGYFWEFDVQREESQLMIRGSNPIGVLPPKKGKKVGDDRAKMRRRPPMRSGMGGEGSGEGLRDYRSGPPVKPSRGPRDASMGDGAASLEPRQPFSKPVKRTTEHSSDA